jgi:3-deoxy-manno-octulosonate cytidylyltransferase (CMP-KDO synthetase)
MAATRLPGKPLLTIGERTVVEWVHRRTEQTGVFDQVVVATPDLEIHDAVKKFGGEVELTSGDHLTGTDRVAEVARRLPQYDVIANVQGDQPFVDEVMLRALVEPYIAGDRPDMVTIGAPLPPDGYADPDTVKVITNRASNALYFSRSPIPNGYSAADGIDCLYHHLGLYAFTSSYLQRYANLPATPLERTERLEQLRALEHGATIRVATVDHGRLIEINTPHDLEQARQHVGRLS